MGPIVRESQLHLGALIAGTDLERMHEIGLMAKPTIPPMTRQPFSNTIPDFVVTGDRTFEKIRLREVWRCYQYRILGCTLEMGCGDVVCTTVSVVQSTKSAG